MRTKTRTTVQLKPGMVARITNALPETGLHEFREIATIETLTPYAERFITFTDGTRIRYSNAGEFDVARSKAQRKAAKARAGRQQAGVVESALALLGAYAVKAA